jgi:hypothetical protein
LDTDLYYIAYQEFYKDIKVENGGYSIKVGGPDNPCLEAKLMALHIFSNIDVAVEPNVDSSDLDSIIAEFLEIEPSELLNLSEPELMICNNLISDCEFNLVWKINYFVDSLQTAYIDAINGNVIKTYSAIVSLNSCLSHIRTPNHQSSDSSIRDSEFLPFINTSNYDLLANVTGYTLVYGTQVLDNLYQGGNYYMMSPDEYIKVYKFYNINKCTGIKFADFTQDKIPYTGTNSWSSDGASKSLSQGFFVVQTMRPWFEDLGIAFGSINLGLNCLDGFNAWSSSNGDDLYLLAAYSDYSEKGMGTFDILGHEIAHGYIRKFFERNLSRGHTTLHEGIADMFGIYMESLYQGSVDWIVGDDTTIGDTRDDSDPQYKCYTNIINNSIPYLRMGPLVYWFYLLSNGELGISTTLKIVMDALALGGAANTDYQAFKNNTIIIAEQMFGRCSEEFTAIAAAWDSICLGGTPVCDYKISGPHVICEEDDEFELCIEGGIGDAKYNWTIIGPKSTEWVLDGYQIGNSLIDAFCFTVLDLPKYDYYPQYLTIRVDSHSPTPGYNDIRYWNIKLIDCNNDDPHCDELTDLKKKTDFTSNSFNQVQISIYNENNNGNTRMELFDLSGKLIYQGFVKKINNIVELVDYNGIAICKIYDNLDCYVNSFKIYIR